MSWLKKVSVAIANKKSNDEINAIMAAAVGSVGAKLEAVVAETDPDDYPLLIALLRSTLRTLTEHLDETPLALAILLEKKIATVAVVLPREKREK